MGVGRRRQSGVEAAQEHPQCHAFAAEGGVG